MVGFYANIKLQHNTKLYILNNIGNMADAAARREARRRKILENSEKRMNRLTSRPETTNSEIENQSTEGVSRDQLSEKWLCQICSHENPSKRDTCFLCSSQKGQSLSEASSTTEKSAENEQFKDVTISESKTAKDDLSTDQQTKESNQDVDDEQLKRKKDNTPTSIPQHDVQHEGLRLRQSKNTVKIQKPAVKAVTQKDEKDQSTETKTLKHKSGTQKIMQFDMYRILGCILLAFVCRMVLQTGYGLLYFQSVALPFLIFQAGLYYHKICVLKESALQARSNMMSAALVLCGIKSEIVATYNGIMGYIKAVSEDFALFIFMFFMSGLIIA